MDHSQYQYTHVQTRCAEKKKSKKFYSAYDVGLDREYIFLCDDNQVKVSLVQENGFTKHNYIKN